jgi:hypothetical protein
MSTEHGEVPNFLYVGTSKAGSTWLFNVLWLHPEVFLADSKGLYYFDSHYEQGEDAYLRNFAGAQGYQAIGEISHSYLSSPVAAERIAELNPQMRLLVCLREPVDRAFSDYLDLVKNRQYDGSFESALERVPRLVERGRYATHLHRYLRHFPRDQVHVALFDDLQSDPQRYADDVFRFLGVPSLDLSDTALRPRMPAGAPRNAAAAGAAKRASRVLAKIGLRRLRSQVKRSARVRQLLYRPYSDDRPAPPPTVVAELRRQFQVEVTQLDEILGTPVSDRWSYGEPSKPSAAEIG